VPEQTTSAIPHAQYFGSHIVVIASPFGHAAPLAHQWNAECRAGLSARGLHANTKPI
jgi:hypothetical protein